jgi:predicted secreted Zn-dependent protease
MLNAIVAALFLTAVAAGSDDEVLARLHVQVDAHDLTVSSCRNVFAGDPEAGLATIGFRYRVADAHALPGGQYTGTVVFELSTITISVPDTIRWPQMSQADRIHVDALRRAIVHHEIGHVRVAEAVRNALNPRAPIVAPDVFAFRAEADAVGRAGFERFTREEREYDALTDHGRRQNAAPPPLGGADTILQCSAD